MNCLSHQRSYNLATSSALMPNATPSASSATVGPTGTASLATAALEGPADDCADPLVAAAFLAPPFAASPDESAASAEPCNAQPCDNVSPTPKTTDDNDFIPTLLVGAAFSSAGIVSHRAALHAPRTSQPSTRTCQSTRFARVSSPYVADSVGARSRKCHASVRSEPIIPSRRDVPRTAH